MKVRYEKKYVERNMCDFLTEYIENKFLFSPQDIYFVYFDIYPKYKEFTEENINRLYRYYIEKKNNIFVVSILIPNSMGKFILKSHRNIFQTEDSVRSNLRGKVEYTDKMIEKKMYEIGYLYPDEILPLEMKMFTYTMNFSVSKYLLIEDTDKKCYYLRIDGKFLDG